MEKYITNNRITLKYELVGNYYLIAGDDEPKKRPIEIWGQRHLRYLKQHRRTVYTELLTSGNLKRMNSVRETATEIVNNDQIYT